MVPSRSLVAEWTVKRQQLLDGGMVSGKGFVKKDNVKAYLQDDGNDSVETKELIMQERKKITTRPNAWGSEGMGCRAQVEEVAVEARMLLTWKHKDSRENRYKYR